MRLALHFSRRGVAPGRPGRRAAAERSWPASRPTSPRPGWARSSSRSTPGCTPTNSASSSATAAAPRPAGRPVPGGARRRGPRAEARACGSALSAGRAVRRCHASAPSTRIPDRESGEPFAPVATPPDQCRASVLHQRHHRAAQGRDAHPPQRLGPCAGGDRGAGARASGMSGRMSPRCSTWRTPGRRSRSPGWVDGT